MPISKLEKYFHIYNKKYFEGKLPTPALQWADLHHRHFGHCTTREIETYNVLTDEVVSVRTEPLIEIGVMYRNNSCIWRLTLLHEMCHLALWNRKCKDHGRLFNNEMKRLANMGAFNGLW